MELDILDKEFELLQQFSVKRESDRLNERIFNLKLDHDFLKTLSQDKLEYIHVRLHNALSYKRPFAPIDKIKEVHRILVSLLEHHAFFDELDD